MSEYFGSPVVGVSWDEEPCTQYVVGAKDDRLRLTKDWTFYVHLADGTIVMIIIFSEFRFEGSVPSAVWTLTRITNTTPEALPGWCLHDFLYLLIKLGLVAQAEADLCLEFALRGRFNVVQVTAVYRAVWTFGRLYANKPMDENEKLESHRYTMQILKPA